MVKVTQPSDRRPLRIGWFTTANGPGSRGMFTAVLNAIQCGHLNAQFDFIFVNRERGQTGPTDSFLDLAESNEIPTVTISSARFRQQRKPSTWSELRTEFDQAVLARLERFTPDVSVMAGYMLFAPEISRQMLCLNQHPALPGGTIGKWQDAIWDVIEQDADEHGSMIHIATPELDRGPVVTTSSFTIRGPNYDHLWHDTSHRNIAALRRANDEKLPLFAAIRAAGVKREQPLVVETLKAIADGNIDLTAIGQDGHSNPVDMTEQVEAAVARNQP